jgi:hypothetical protein
MTEQNEDCYFWVDTSLSEAERVVNAMCVKCHDTNPTKGWLWEGSKRGYGPYEMTCDVCGHIIYQPPVPRPQ